MEAVGGDRHAGEGGTWRQERVTRGGRKERGARGGRRGGHAEAGEGDTWRQERVTRRGIARGCRAAVACAPAHAA